MTHQMAFHRRARGRVVLACILVAAFQAALVPPAQSQLDARRAEARALEQRIREQGQRLSMADEDFNEARLARQRVEAEARAARDQVAAAEARWGELKAQLAKRVRLMYMHPGAALDVWLSQRSLSDIARAQKLGSSVLTADNELLLQTEKARHEVMSRASRLQGLQGQARAKEQEIGARRAEVARAVEGQRALLSNVTAEISQLMEAERRREIAAAAAQRAQSPSRPAAPAPAAPRTDRAASEPTGPPPPVKASAGQAVAKAAEQIGKPYQWGASGPDSFDCSGLTMYAWASAGVRLPHSSRAQYSSLPKVARKDLQPGDLVFFGSPIHHVGIYEGGGVMINSPETGQNVRRNSIDRRDYAGAARP